MSLDRKEIYEFGEYRLDVDERTIERLDGVPAPTLPDKTFETLVVLVRKRGHLVSKDELLSHVWPDTIVEENNLEKRVHALRQFLGEAENGKGFIETVRGHGYRFVGRVDVVEVSGSWLPESYRTADSDIQPKIVTNSDPRYVRAEAPMLDAGEGATIPATSKRASRSTIVALSAIGVLIVASVVGYFAVIRQSATTSLRSIVVLPAIPIHTTERDELFAVGIADSLINRVASADGLIVRPLNSVREDAGPHIDPIEIGRKQKADYVLATNYQLAGGRIKVTAQLINVATGKTEETFESQQDVADVFAAQDAIAADFGKKLMARFGVSPSHAVRGRGTNNEEAYRAYVQGMYILDKRIAGAIEYMTKAVELDPNYAQAWAGKALAHAQVATSRDHTEYPKAIEAIDKALAMNPDLSEAYSALCHSRFHFDWDLAGAEEACRRAIELDPSSSVARQKYSLVLTNSGRNDEAIAQLKTAMEMEPASYINQVFYANELYFARRFDEAVVQYRTLVNLKPDRIASYNWFIRALEAQGNQSEAFEWFIKSLVAEKKDEEIIQKFKTVYERSGYNGVLLERINTIDRDSVFRKAGLYARLGDKDRAFEMLEKSYEQRHWNMAVLFPVEPQLDSLRSDPRYQDLLKRVQGK